MLSCRTDWLHNGLKYINHLHVVDSQKYGCVLCVHIYNSLSYKNIRGKGFKTGHLVSCLTSSSFVLCLWWNFCLVIRLGTYMLPLNPFTSILNSLQHSTIPPFFLITFSTLESWNSCRSHACSPIVCWENDHVFSLFGFYEIGSHGPG